MRRDHHQDQATHGPEKELQEIGRTTTVSIALCEMEDDTKQSMCFNVEEE